MPTFRVSQRIAAPAGTVWELLADVVAWPRWLPTVSAVEPSASARLALGATYRVVQPRLRPARWKVTELNPGRNFTWEADAPALAMWANHTVHPASSDACDVTLEFRFSGLLAPLVGLLAGGITRRYLATEAASLKALAERIGRGEA
jgi:hypothetical protein